MKKTLKDLAVVCGLSLLGACGEGSQPETTTTEPTAPSSSLEQPVPAEIGLGSKRPTKAAGLPRLTDKMPSSVSSNRPPAKAWDEPQADYTTLAALKAAGQGAVGKRVLIKGYISRLWPGHASSGECDYEGEMLGLDLAFGPEQRDFMRALPTSSSCIDPCPRILAKVTGFDAENFNTPTAEVLAVYDLQPDPPPAKLPVGVDYISIDDALLDGEAALGKVIDVGVYRGSDHDEGGVPHHVLYPQNCSAHGGNNAQLYVAENQGNAAFFKALAFDAGSTCQRVRARLTKGPQWAFPNRFGAELVGVGEQSPRLDPQPCP